MTDSELTAAAARAAGMELEPDSGHPDGSHWMKSGTCLSDGQCVWHPLRNDAHAFRLAVNLDICVEQNDTGEYSYALVDIIANAYEKWVDHAGDKCAATRRAIVRVAAALDRNT